MEVKIAKKGNANGTVGWLARGLEEGTITISEGLCRGIKEEHGLFFDTKNLKFCMAYYGAKYTPKYAVYEEGFEGVTLWGTPATLTALREIALQWCDEMNQVLELEEIPKIQILRVEIEKG